MKSPVLALIVGLSACGDTTRLEVSEQVALGQIGPVGATLNQARRDFVGGGGGPFGGSLTDIPVDYSSGGSVVGTVAVVRSDDLMFDLHLGSKLFAEHGTVRARLSDGLGVFTDPMQVAMWANGVGAELSLGRMTTLSGGQIVDCSAGIGLTRVVSKVHLQSALLDLRATAAVTLPYATFTGRYRPVQGPDMLADIRVFSLGSIEARLGLVQSW